MERSATKRPVQVIDISDEDEHDGDEIEALQGESFELTVAIIKR
jgi:hypothetical protein